MTKICNACKQSKPLTEYHKRTESPDGLQTRCKQCRKDGVTAVRGDYNRRYKLDATTRVCKICKFEKNIKFFPPNYQNKNGRWRVHSTCVICARTMKYGISETEYLMIRMEQNDLCAICKEPLPEINHIDHCHTTNKVRGILCPHCNLMLGHAKDNAQTLQNAIDYLNAATKD